MLNHDGFVAECTGDNIFTINGTVLNTPPVFMGALDGITRRTVMNLARTNSLQVTENPLTRYCLYTADECFLTGTAAEVVPVVEIDGRPIGNGTPGQVTRRLINLFREYATSTGHQIFSD